MTVCENFGQPTTSSPNGGTRHYAELTYTYADGSQKTFPNEEAAFKGIGASFAAAGFCGGWLLCCLQSSLRSLGSPD